MSHLRVPLPSRPLRGPVAPTLWCFTNGCYTLPLFLSNVFFFSHPQKLHWRKLTCKVDSSVCLKHLWWLCPVWPPLQTPPPSTRRSPHRPRPLEPDVSLEFTHLPSETGFSPIGIQAPLASCIGLWGARIWLRANVSCVVFLRGLYLGGGFKHRFLPPVEDAWPFVATILHEFPCNDHLQITCCWHTCSRKPVVWVFGVLFAAYLQSEHYDPTERQENW